MKAAPKDLKRSEFFKQLVHFFEAYLVLTRQVRDNVEAGEVERVARFLVLRQETIERIEALQKLFPKHLEIPIEKENNGEVFELRERLRSIVTDCLTVERNLEPKMKALKENSRREAETIASRTRGIRGYTQYADRRARYIQQHK